VTDSELSSSVSTSVLVTASTPTIDSQTEGPELAVPLGYVNFPVTVTASGVPAPAYQWQYMTLENVTVPDNATMTRRNAYDFEDYEPDYEVHWFDDRALIQVIFCYFFPYNNDFKILKK
jgi:hypothetical protein